MDYTYSQYTYDTDPQVESAAIAAVIVFFLFFAVVSYALVAFLLSRLFKKAGVPEWAAWVPVYNNWKLLELGNQPGFWAVLSLIPFVNIIATIFTYIATYHIGLKLQKAGWFVLLAIFLPLIWLIWLGFDDSKWPKKSVAKKPLARKKAVKATKTAKATKTK